MIDFKLPSLGADMDEGKLLEWLIKPGDSVKRGQVVAVVDTTKAAVEVESWQEGIVDELLVQPEQKIAVGTVMARFRAPDETAAEAGTAVPSASAPACGREIEGESLVGRKERPQSQIPPLVRTPATITRAADAGEGERSPRDAATSRRERRISPAARQRAAELHVDLGRIASGSGPQQAISLADVERAAQRTPEPAPAAAAMADRAAEMRRTIAAAMSRSKREIPHYYLAETIPMRRMVDWLGAENAARPMAQRLLMAVPLLKAVALALKKFPELNGWYRENAFVPSPAVHLGVAIALRQGGLVAPAIHDVAERTLSELMTALGDLIQRTRAGKLRSSELSDATITVTSLGEQGVDWVQGVIYPPQVALVGLGRVVERPWAVDGALLAMPVVTASLAADHRVSDGHRGALFLAALRELLQQPEQLSEPR